MTPHPSIDGREPLNREKIVDKAIEILDAQGVKGMTMRRIGEALGVEAMALYNHFPNKDALLDAVAARIVEETEPNLDPTSGDWKTFMLSGPASAGRAIEAHPNAGWLFLGREYATAASLSMLEAPLSILYSAGFRGQGLVDAAHAIFAYAAGWYLLSSGQGGSWSGPSEAALAAVGDGAPLTAAHAKELADWGRGFEEGMLLILDGLEAKLQAARDSDA